MSEEVNKEQTKDAKQEKTTELTGDQLDEAAGGLEAHPDIEWRKRRARLGGQEGEE